MSVKYQFLLTVALLLATVVLAFNAVRLASPTGLWAEPQAVTPYTTILKETAASSDGVRRIASVQTIAMRSDGSTVMKLGAADEGSRVIHFASGIRVVTHDELRLKSSTRESAARRRTDENCIDPDSKRRPTVVGHETVAGYRAVKLTRTDVTQWLALDYNCALLRQTMDFGEQGIIETQLIALTPGEPDPTLFAIPEDYKESPPSSLTTPPGAGCDADCRKRAQTRNEMLDKEYYRLRVGQ